MYPDTLTSYRLKAAPKGFPDGPVVKKKKKKNPLANAGDTGHMGSILGRLNPWVQSEDPLD